jgi:hypothetical protein
MEQVRPPGRQFVAALQAAGMPDVPERFSVALLDQQILAASSPGSTSSSASSTA